MKQDMKIEELETLVENISNYQTYKETSENIRKLEDDFKQEYQERRDAYEGNDGLLTQLETGFKWLYNTTSTSNEILRTKKTGRNHHVFLIVEIFQ